jgi:UDP-glucose:(heptosyl)LPS alpha-1,3-glucosyltransferase
MRRSPARRGKREIGASSGADTPNAECARVSAERQRVILIAHDVEDRGGMERSLVENVRRGTADVDFCLVSSTLEPDLRGRVEWKRVPVPRRPFLLKFAIFYLLGAVQVARAGPGLRQSTGAVVPNRADIAVIHFCHAGYLAKTGRTAATSLSRAKRWHERLIRKASLLAERWSYSTRRLRCFVAVSEGVRRELEQFYPGVPCEVAPNGVDHHRFRPDPEARPQLRRQLGAARDDLIAVFVGGDWARKGLGVAISAIADARRSHRAPVSLWIVGPGDQFSYRALAREEDVEPNVRFFGRRSDTERFYRAADAFILPSLYETFSLAAVEAAACGLPIVTTSRDGVFQELERAGAALVCDRSPAAVGGALGLLAHDRARREAVGRLAREQSTRYTWERQASDLVTLYARLVQEAHPSGDC